VLDEGADERIQQEATAEVDAAVRTAEAAEPPEVSDFTTKVLEH